jgi:hypothetical protein
VKTVKANPEAAKQATLDSIRAGLQRQGSMRMQKALWIAAAVVFGPILVWAFINGSKRQAEIDAYLAETAKYGEVYKHKWACARRDDPTVTWEQSGEIMEETQKHPCTESLQQSKQDLTEYINCDHWDLQSGRCRD